MTISQELTAKHRTVIFDDMDEIRVEVPTSPGNVSHCGGQTLG